MALDLEKLSKKLNEALENITPMETNREEKYNIFGFSEDTVLDGKKKIFYINFGKLNEEEIKTIKKIITITNLPSFFEKQHLVFQTLYGYQTFKEMYEHSGIDKKIIKQLKDKKILLGMLNTYGKGSVGIFFYFTPECDFAYDFLKRRVLIEKI